VHEARGRIVRNIKYDELIRSYIANEGINYAYEETYRELTAERKREKYHPNFLELNGPA
jgi:hypothetical protein